MIEILYHRQDLKVTVKGHANYDEQGKDIVCSAVTSLMYCLGMFAEEYYDADKLYFEPIVKLESGGSEVSIVVRGTFEKEARVVFDTICNGLELIAKTYPENVSYRKVYPM